MVGSPDDLVPDRGPSAARQALAAAAELRVFDASATAWLVVQRLLEVVGMAGLLLGIVFGSLLVGQWLWIVLGAGTLVLAFEGPTARLAGAEPRRWPTRWRLALVAAVMAAVVILGIVSRDPSTGTGNWPPLATCALVATCYLLAPVVRCALSLRRVPVRHRDRRVPTPSRCCRWWHASSGCTGCAWPSSPGCPSISATRGWAPARRAGSSSRRPAGRS